MGECQACLKKEDEIVIGIDSNRRSNEIIEEGI